MTPETRINRTPITKGQETIATMSDLGNSELGLQMAGYRLTTAEILYHMPDHPGLLQTYVWQELDLAPKFPELRRFLDFWTRELDGPLHSVKVCSAGLIAPAKLEMRDAEFRLH